uniref:PWWP domain-containing protein n=1 Tax=Bursaphelenchus xylophilus TaxID=6326 RepID=A0A1I7RKZ1_BURXY
MEIPEFKVGDLVWAKMRGYPHWPAQISKNPTQSNGKYVVSFFGTQESAFVKPSDICDYFQNLDTYGIPRKLNDFQKAMEEIKEVAKKKAKKGQKKENSNSTPRQQRNRIPNRLISNEDFVVPQPKKLKGEEKSGKSDSGAPSQNNSPRKRTDSASSTERSRKRISYSERFGVDLSDIESTYPNAVRDNLFPGFPMFEGLESEQSEDEINKLLGVRKRRRTRSRLFDDYFLPGTGKRDRSGSFSSTNGRTRLISGFSDTFDDLDFNPHVLFNAIDDLPSEESDRAITPEAPTAMPLQEKKCYSCGCLCDVVKRKWKCSNRDCNRWNGVLETPSMKPASVHPLAFNWDKTYLEDIPMSDSSDKADFKKPLTLDTGSGADMAADQITKIKQELMIEETVSATATPVPEPSPVQPADPVLASSSSIFQFKEQIPPQREPPKEMPPGMIPPQKSQIIHNQEPSGIRLEQYEPHKRMIRPGNRSRAKVEKTPPVTSNGVRYCYFCPGQVRPQMCGGNKHRWRCVDKKCRKWYGWVKSSDEIPRDLGKKGRWKDLVIRVQSSQNEFEDRLASDMIQKNGDQDAYGQDEERGRVKRRYRRCKPQPWRDISPLTVKESYYEPSCMEQRPRWWIQERKKADFSPEREFGVDILDAAASFRLIANSMLTAANTKTDEYGSVNGALDLLMDSLMSSLGPLMTIAKHIPGLNLPEETLQRVKIN